MGISVIYAIVNIVNDKHYVGQTYDNLKRFGEHLKTLRTGKHCNRLLQRAYYKYGETCFIFVTLEKCSKENLTVKEQYWIDVLKPEYNLAPVAGSQLGYKHTDEARLNMSNAHKGYKASAETRAKMSEQRKGNKFAAGVKQSLEHIEARARVIRGRVVSAETLAKRSASLKGRIISEETKRKMSEAAKRRWHSS